MDRREQLQSILEAITPKVYFQPPSDTKMVYPCIRYIRAPGYTGFADNKPYLYEQQYEVTLIAEQPTTEIFPKIAALPKTVHSRSFVAGNLNHDVFSIYF